MDEYPPSNASQEPSASIPNPPPFQVQRPDLSVGVCFAGGWDFFKSRTGLVYGVILAELVFVGAMILLGNVAGPDAKAEPFAHMGWQQIINYLFVPLHVGPTVLLVRAMRGEVPDGMYIFSGLKRFFGLILVSILMQIVVVLGLMLLIVPGIILGLGLQFSSLMMVDYGMGVRESLEKSWEMMSGYKWPFFLLILALALLNILGMLALGIGLLVTAPLTMAITMYFYTALASSHFGIPQNRPGERM